MMSHTIDDGLAVPCVFLTGVRFWGLGFKV
jgi:hypothetical protein